jgi:pilus assembly protein Flp/PilA
MNLRVMTSLLMRYLRDESGATAIEYSLIAALIGVVILGSVKAAGVSVKELFDGTATAVSSF